MIKKFTALMPIMAVMLIAISWQSANAGGCAGDPSCIEITFKEDLSAAPDVDPEELYVEREVRKKFKRVRFFVDGPKGLTHARIKFKCGDTDEYCRYEAPFANESEGWITEFDVIRGMSKNLPIAKHLPDCDNECLLTNKKCIEKRCTYSYSIYNHEGEMVLDPDTIMEPK